MRKLIIVIAASLATSSMAQAATTHHRHHHWKQAIVTLLFHYPAHPAPAVTSVAASNRPSGATCPAGVPSQVVTVVDDADVAPAALDAVQQAVSDQSLQLRSAWGTPCVSFGPGGWVVTLTQGCQADPSGGISCVLDGEHGYDGVPYAQVSTGALPGTTWGQALSHEVMEMMEDPELSTRYASGLVEVCDPVEKRFYLLDGVAVSDFTLPSYFSGAAGPWDHMSVLGI